MINQESLTALAQSRFGKKFVKPLYEGYAFAALAGTIEKLLTTKTANCFLPEAAVAEYKEVDAVVVVFLDAFGWTFLDRYQDYPPIRRLLDRSIANKISSHFPSTTANHVLGIHSGYTPGETGIYEWYQYHHKLNRIIMPLYGSYAGDREKNTLAKDIKAEDLFPESKIYSSLTKQGFESFLQFPEYFSGSLINQSMAKFTKTSPFKDWVQGLSNLVDLVNDKSNRGCFGYYFDDYDHYLHRFGPFSPESEKCLFSFFNKLEELFFNKLKRNIAFMLVADHGQVATPSENVWYLNQNYPKITECLRVGADNKHLVPGGSARDFFLYLKPNKIAEVKNDLTTMLRGIAEVHEVKTLAENGFFGKVTEGFLKNAGDLVILPYEKHTVWWYEQGVYEHNMRGHHGGLTPAEMETTAIFSYL